MLDVHCTRPPERCKGIVPYAALPHDLVADPRLTPADVRVAAALLYWARGKDHCWPGNAAIAARVGCCPGTAQRSLRCLEKAGWIAREETDANRTGRLIVLAWRRAGADPPAPPALGAPAAPAPPEGIVIVKETAPKEVGPIEVSRLRSEPPARAVRAARPASRPRRRALLTREDYERFLRSDDPVLVAEATRLLSPRPAPQTRPAPRDTAEFLARIRESPDCPGKAAELLAQGLDDRKSWPALHAVCRRAWAGELPPEALVTAWRDATNGRARNPGALFMAVVKRESRSP